MVQNCFKIISRQRKKYTPAEPPPLKSDLFLKPSQNVLKVVVYFFDGFPYSIYHLFIYSLTFSFFLFSPPKYSKFTHSYLVADNLLKNDSTNQPLIFNQNDKMLNALALEYNVTYNHTEQRSK